MFVKKPENRAFCDFLRDQISSARFLVSSQVVLCKLITIEGETITGRALITNDRPDLKALKRLAYKEAFKRLRLNRVNWLVSFSESEI